MAGGNPIHSNAKEITGDACEKRVVLTAVERRLIDAYEQAKLIDLSSAEKTEEQRLLDEQRLARFEACLDERREEFARIRSGVIAPGGGVASPKELFSEIPSIAGERIVIDRVVDTDADAMAELAGNASTYRYEPTFLFERRFADPHEAIRQLYGDIYAKKQSLILAVRLKETGKMAGLAEFYGLRDTLHKVSIGCRLIERYWGQGIATEVVGLMAGYLYGETDIEIIMASSMADNAGSAHSLANGGLVCFTHVEQEDWGHAEPTVVDKWLY